MDYSRNEGTDYIPSLSYSPSLAVVSSLALVLATWLVCVRAFELDITIY